jgi:hypothetical protein
MPIWTGKETRGEANRQFGKKAFKKENHGTHPSPWYGVPGYTTHKRTDFTLEYVRRERNVSVRMYHLLFATFLGT